MNENLFSTENFAENGIAYPLKLKTNFIEQELENEYFKFLLDLVY